MEQIQVYSFDWFFLKLLMNKLDKLNKKYYICHSHYVNNITTPKQPHHTTIRILGTKGIINQFIKFEKENLKILGYIPFDKDNEIKNGPLTIKKLADNKSIKKRDMIEVFKIWDATSRLKIKLIDLWQKGKGSSWKEGVHYALNSFGLSSEMEVNYIRWNLPNKIP
jgi:hypothetical protein